MSSILAVSADPSLCDQLGEIAQRGGFRLRVVSSGAAARDWLAMQSFDVLIVDDCIDDDTPVTLLNLGWKHNAVLIGSIISLKKDVQDPWMLRAMGAHVFSGPNAMQTLEKTLRKLPEKIRLGEDFAILVVEDLDSPRDIICAYIEGLGYPDVTGVESVSSALKLLRGNPSRYSCVVTDLNLPGESGVDLIQTIRREEDLDHLPIVVLTAQATPENLLACIQAGATGFLVKPPKKKLLRIELEKARRILFSDLSPSLCRSDDAAQVEEAVLKLIS